MEPKTKQVLFYIFFSVPIALFSFLSFTFAKHTIEIETKWPVGFLWLAMALFILGALFSLAWLLLVDSKRSKYFLLALALICSGWLFIFLDPKGLIFWFIFLILLASVYFAGHQAIKEKRASFKIHLSRILSLALSVFYTGIILVIASFYYFHQARLPLETFRVPPNITRFVVDQLDNFLDNGKLGGELSLSMTIDEYFQAALLKEDSFKEYLDDSRVKNLLSQEIEARRQELNREYDLHLTGEEKIGQVLTVFITAKINQILGPYRRYIPLALAFGLFIALRAIAFIYVNIVLGMVWVLLKVMMFFKLVRIEKVMAEKEVIQVL